MRRAEVSLVLVAWLSLVPSLAPGEETAPEETPPGDDFLEYLGAWDEAWQQACDPDGYLPGDAACEPTEDERDDEN